MAIVCPCDPAGGCCQIGSTSQRVTIGASLLVRPGVAERYRRTNRARICSDTIALDARRYTLEAGRASWNGGAGAMGNRSHTGHLQFCVEVGQPPEQTSLAAHRELLSTCQQLEVMFNGHDIRPTWAIERALMETIGGSLQRGATVALLAASHTDLDDYVATAKNIPAEARYNSIVTRAEPTLLQVAQLSALGIRAIGLPLTNEPHAARVQTRHGLSLIRTTGHLPGFGRFLGRWDAGFQAKGLIHRSMLRESTEALSIQLDRLQQPIKVFRTLQKMLAIAKRIRSAGRLRCETLAEAHARFCPASSGEPAQQSVLRAA